MHFQCKFTLKYRGNLCTTVWTVTVTSFRWWFIRNILGCIERRHYCPCRKSKEKERKTFRKKSIYSRSNRCLCLKDGPLRSEAENDSTLGNKSFENLPFTKKLHSESVIIVNYRTENHKKAWVDGKKSSHRKSKKPERKKTTDWLFYKNLQQENKQKKPTPGYLYSWDMLLNNSRAAEDVRRCDEVRQTRKLRMIHGRHDLILK